MDTKVFLGVVLMQTLAPRLTDTTHKLANGFEGEAATLESLVGLSPLACGTRRAEGWPLRS